MSLAALVGLQACKEDVVEDLKKSLAWLTDGRLYDAGQSTTLERSTLSKEHMTLLSERGKIEAATRFRGTCKLMKVPEDAKQRFRVIQHPKVINDKVPQDGTVHFLPQLDRHRAVLVGDYAFDLDFAAFFDQFPLGEEVKQYFSFKTEDGIYHMNVLPMGFKHSVWIAQSTTLQLLNYNVPESVHVEPYIDNVRFVGPSREEVAKAVAPLLVRAAKVGVTVNDMDVSALALGDADALRQATEMVKPRVYQKGAWLGETFDYANKTVEMNERTREKIEALLPSGRQLTFKNIAAQFAMLLYASRTYGLKLGPFFSARRAHAAISRLLTARPELWDKYAPAMCDNVNACLTRWQQTILACAPKLVRPDDAPEVFAIVDASAWGCGGAYVDEYGREHEFKQKWDTDDWWSKHSAYAEPEAAFRLIYRFVKPASRLKLHLVTDSSTAKGAIFKGHSSSFTVNAICTRLASNFPNLEVITHHIKGKDNPVDGISRGEQQLKVDEWDCIRNIVDGLKQSTA